MDPSDPTEVDFIDSALSSPRPSNSDDSSTTCVERPSSAMGNPLPRIDHAVQFYDTQDYIINVLTNFVAPILKTKDAAVVIATKPKLDALKERLRARGVHVEVATKTGQLVLLDANETLEQITNFEDEDNPVTLLPISQMLHELRDKFPQTYVYGELVNLLCDRGNHRAALLLEELWHGLIKKDNFALLCGYDTNNFKEQHLNAAFRDVCSAHSHVNSSEALFNLPTEKDTLIALLKQNTIALETEIERRKSVEFALQRYFDVLSTRAQESLRVQHESYRKLLSILPVGVYSIEMMMVSSAPEKKNHDGIFVNKKFCELVGMSEDEIRESGWKKAVHPDDRERVKHLWDINCREDLGGRGHHSGLPGDRSRTGTQKFRYLHPDQSIRWVSSETVQFTMPSHSDVPFTYVLTIVDITQVKQAELSASLASAQTAELLRHRAELAEKHKEEQDRFVDTLCHELRNPLYGLQANTELLQLGLEVRQSILSHSSSSSSSSSSALSVFKSTDLEQLREQARWDQESLAAIEKCVAHQKVITDDVLNLSKLEVGKVILNSVDFNPKDSISNVTKMFEAEAQRKGVTLRVNLPVSDVIIKGDPDRVSQILINLLANALKFTEKGSITLELDFSKKEEEEEEDCFLKVMTVSVKDTGEGLTKEEKGMLFQRFAQTTSTSYHEHGGSGLGLAISKGLVELMGGTLSVESVKGQGSEFTFTIHSKESPPPPPPPPPPQRLHHHHHHHRPSIPSPSPPPSPPPPPPPPPHLLPPSPYRKNRRWINEILIVEDNTVNQRFLTRLLQLAGFSCTTASNGLQALDLIFSAQNQNHQNHFDLILMDIHMPVMDGITCTREIRAREAAAVTTRIRRRHDDDAEGSGSGVPPIPIIGLSGNARKEHKTQALRCGMNAYLTKPCRKQELYSAIDQFEEEEEEEEGVGDLNN